MTTSKGCPARSLGGDLLEGLARAKRFAVLESEERTQEVACLLVRLGLVQKLETMARTRKDEGGRWAAAALEDARPYLERLPPELWPPEVELVVEGLEVLPVGHGNVMTTATGTERDEAARLVSAAGVDDPDTQGSDSQPLGRRAGPCTRERNRMNSTQATLTKAQQAGLPEGFLEALEEVRDGILELLRLVQQVRAEMDSFQAKQ
jgi:hypothetical protein